MKQLVIKLTDEKLKEVIPFILMNFSDFKVMSLLPQNFERPTPAPAPAFAHAAASTSFVSMEIPHKYCDDAKEQNKINLKNKADENFSYRAKPRRQVINGKRPWQHILDILSDGKFHNIFEIQKRMSEIGFSDHTHYTPLKNLEQNGRIVRSHDGKISVYRLNNNLAEIFK